MTDEPDEEEPDEDEPVPAELVLPIEDHLDLHAFQPRDVRSVVLSYLEEAIGAGFREVRLIHGKGGGVQREIVRSLLGGHPAVLRFADAPPERGGWGATLVCLDVSAPAVPQFPARREPTKMPERLEVVCPCCGDRLTVDAASGEVLAEERPKIDPSKSFEQAMKEVRGGSQRREEAFTKAFDRTQRLDDLLDKKFEEAKKKASTDRSKPRGPFDAD